MGNSVSRSGELHVRAITPLTSRDRSPHLVLSCSRGYRAVTAPERAENVPRPTALTAWTWNLQMPV